MRSYFSIFEQNRQGRDLVVPDIHGCAYTLEELLQQVGLSKNDRLFLLGDFVNKGPNNKRVLDVLLELKAQQYQVFPLRGNHEDMMLEIHANGYDFLRNRFPWVLGSESIFYPSMKMKEPYLEFIEQLPYYYELPNAFLVHAGFDFSHETPFMAFDKMLVIKNYQIDEALLKGKHLIHGHAVTPLVEIQRAVYEAKTRIPLDNGCASREKLLSGHLMCLDLNSFELYSQKNIDWES